MISAASQTLAEWLAQELAPISQEQISFEHPRLWQKDKPGLNLYCYRIQEVDREKQTNYRWFELTFLISAADYTTLGEQHLLSRVLTMLSQYQFLPDSILDCTLRGCGTVGVRVVTQAPAEDLQFWTVLCAPFQLALHVSLTVPYPILQQVELVS
jgi:hypothetical protein